MLQSVLDSEYGEIRVSVLPFQHARLVCVAPVAAEGSAGGSAIAVPPLRGSATAESTLTGDYSDGAGEWLCGWAERLALLSRTQCILKVALTERGLRDVSFRARVEKEAIRLLATLPASD